MLGHVMLDFQVPRISAESADDTRGSFTIEPLDRGFGYTFGNSLRRVLLSSLAGAAVTSVRIEGVAHEFSTIRGVKEDVTDIVLNLKGIVCRMHSDATEIEAPLVVTGPGDITAKDIDLPSGVEILNPDAHIATLEKTTKLEVYLTIGRGRGYRPAEEIQTVGDLVSKTEGELNAIPNFGKKSIDEVIETLHARGLDLRND
jgi:DNA-directed RNA polymerase subunit alpha